MSGILIIYEKIKLIKIAVWRNVCRTKEPNKWTKDQIRLSTKWKERSIKGGFINGKINPISLEIKGKDIFNSTINMKKLLNSSMFSNK